MSIKRHSLNFSSNRLQLHHSVYHPLRLRRRVGILDLLGEVKIFLISGGGGGGERGCLMREGKDIFDIFL